MIYFVDRAFNMYNSVVVQIKITQLLVLSCQLDNYSSCCHVNIIDHANQLWSIQLCV